MLMLNRFSCFLFVFLWTLSSFPLSASEPAEAFLEALRERRMHDMALDYLDRAEKNPLVDQEIRERLDLERGLTLIQGAAYQGDFAIRESMLDDAQTYLDKFIRTRQGHPKVTSAQSQLANLLEQRATMKVEKANSPSGSGDKSKLLNEANELYTKAYASFRRMQNDLKERLEELPPTLDPAKDKEKIALRDELRKEFLQAKLVSAVIKEEQAECYPEDSQERKDALNQAVTEFGKVYEDYRQRLAGLYAFMYQGRCFQKLGKLKEALANYVDLLDQPDSPDAFRVLKTKVLVMAMECWMDPSQKKHAEAIQQATEWVKKIRPNEQSNEQWLQVRFLLATASRDYADIIKKTKPGDPQIRGLISDAKKQCSTISRFPGPYQDPAKKLLAELGGRKVNEGEEGKEPTNFVEAKDAGKDAIDAVEVAKRVLELIPARIAQEKDAEIKADLQKQVDEAKQTLATGRSKALDNFRLAMKFVEPDTPLAEVNAVRYYLCYLYYENSDYFSAAMLGEFLARRYPSATGARQCAKIAMASFIKLYAEDQTGDKSFESEHTIGIARYITETWPDQPEAEDAFNTLIPFMIKAGDLEAAQAFMEQIPVDSDRRGQAELTTGQAMWAAYLKGMRAIRKSEKGEDVDEELKTTEELNALKGKAQEVLAAGVERMKQNEKVNPTVLTAGLSLAQIYVDTDQAQSAVTQLEDAKIGPLVLIRKNAGGATEAITQEVLKTALRAYIASLESAEDGAAVNAKAKGIMEELKAATGDDQKGQEKLVGIYISLAQDLKDQISLLESEDAKTKLTTGFESFLDEVFASTKELSVMNWVAQTFGAMAEGLNTGTALSPAAKKYFDKSISTYDKMLADGSLSDSLKIQLRMKKASSLAQISEYEKAVEIFETILKENNMMLEVQARAADVYMQWGKLAKDNEIYKKAVLGDKLDAEKKPTIWGLIKLSKIAVRHKYMEQFYDARRKLAECHLAMAQNAQGADQTKYFDLAKKDIITTQNAYRDLGGDESFEQFNKLYKSIQGKAGEKVTGLEKKETLVAVVELPEEAPEQTEDKSETPKESEEEDEPATPPLSPTMQYVLLGSICGVGLIAVVAGIIIGGGKKKRKSSAVHGATETEEPDFSKHVPKARGGSGGSGGEVNFSGIGEAVDQAKTKKPAAKKPAAKSSRPAAQKPAGEKPAGDAAPRRVPKRVPKQKPGNDG